MKNVDGSTATSLPAKFSVKTQLPLAAHAMVAFPTIALMLMPAWHGQQTFIAIHKIWGEARATPEAHAADRLANKERKAESRR